MKIASYKGVKVNLPTNVSISAFKDIVNQCGTDYGITVQSVVDLLSRKLSKVPTTNKATPELLEALEALTGIIEIGKRDMSNPKYDGYFNRARTAIKKATGQ